VKVQVGLDGEPATGAQRRNFALPRAVKSFVELGGGAVGQHRDSASQGEPAKRTLLFVVVVTGVKVWVHLDRFDLNGVERNLVSTGDRTGRQQSDALDLVGVGHGVLECRHSCGTAADDGGPLCHAQLVGKRFESGGLVANGQIGESRTPFPTVGGDGRWAGRALAASQGVRADHEPLVRVDAQPGTDDASPPTIGGMAGTGRSRDV